MAYKNVIFAEEMQRESVLSKTKLVELIDSFGKIAHYDQHPQDANDN